jgi:glycine betaine catabolism A
VSREATPTRDALRAVLRPMERAAGLPPCAFTSPEVLELEERALFATSWIPVAHEADLARPGDWVRAPLRGEQVAVVRGADLGLGALHALCAHRGTLLCDGEGGHWPELQVRCPYHGWTYATDGRLLAAPGGPPPAEAPGLSRARVEARAGVVFVNVDAEAPGLDESWQGGPPWLARVAVALERVSRTDHEVHANWKVLVGNFQESHHFPSVHPSLEARTPWRRSSSVVTSEAWLGGVMELAEGCETVSETGLRDGRPFVAAAQDRRRVHDAYVFPLWLTSLQPDYLLTYRLAPLAADRTLVVAEIHVHPGARGAGHSVDSVVSFWERTNAEDRAICERQQRGLASRHARAGRYAASEDGLHAFERLVAARYLRALYGEAP